MSSAREISKAESLRADGAAGYPAWITPLVDAMRTDVTATRRDDTGVVAWTREPLTPERLEAHLAGTKPRGLCPIRAGEDSLRVALLDLDSHKGEIPWPQMAATAARLIGQAADIFGIHLHPWRSSGGNGIHLCALWAEPQDAYSARQALRQLLGTVGCTDGAGGLAKKQIEVYPRQDSVSATGFGNMFILPGFNRSVPLDPLFLEPQTAADFARITWTFSRPVPDLEKPPEKTSSEDALVSLEHARAYLMAIDNVFNPPDYDHWRDIIFAVHAGTGGSPEGLELAAAWSAQNPAMQDATGVYDSTFLRTRVWPYIKAGGGITFGTVERIAREQGFTPPPILAAEGFGFTERPADPDPPAVFPVTVLPGAAALSGAPPPAVPAEQGPPQGAVALDGEDDWPVIQRDKNGIAEPTMSNLLMAARSPSMLATRVAFDTFRDEIMLAPPGGVEWRPISDDDYVYARARLEATGFKPVAKENARDVLHAVAKENKFDSAIDWLNAQRWDGKPRIETFLTRYFGVDDTPYARAVASYLWTAMAGRVLSPGCQADMVPILVGRQGAGKSSAIQAMVPRADLYATMHLDTRDADTSRLMKGRLLAEIEEMRGLHTRESEAIKAFITRRDERWTPKYKEFTTSFQRRLVFIGTTNDVELLSDETGNRRWLPIKVGREPGASIERDFDVAAIERDRLQLWAEAATVFTASGIQWREAHRLAPAAHAEHMVSDPWEPIVEKWLATPDMLAGGKPADAPVLAGVDILIGALHKDRGQITKTDERRVGRVMRALGWENKKTRRIDGGSRWGYVRRGAE